MAFAILRCLQSPRQATAPSVAMVWILELSLVPIAVWSGYLDVHFFREVLPRNSGSAARDVILERAIGWSCTIIYFLGYAIWPDIVGRLGA